MISQEELKKILSYDHESGKFHWIKTKIFSRVKPGAVAGSIAKLGYIKIKIEGKYYLAHRLAWLYTHGKFPELWLDHRNGNPSDNRMSNLREASISQNSMNRKAQGDKKYKGITWHKKANRWQAQIRANGVSKYLGCFTAPEDAHAAYVKAAKELQQDFFYQKI